MIERVKELEKDLNSIDYNKLWKGFSKTKYAIYNDKIFYINDNSRIDISLIKEDSFYRGNTDERFIGNTAIKINGEYVAIWNEEYISKDMDNKRLASLIIHEMFHCYQMANGEKRFPNEMLGIDYPITVQNIRLRMLERQYLLDACIENDKEKKMELLTLFYNVRDERENLIGKVMDYEKALESLEGTAVYVEFKALAQLTQDDEKLLLKKYVEGFAEISEENLKIRGSTYIQGLLLGLIADKYILNWQSELFNSEEFLSDFTRVKLDIKEIKVNHKEQDLEGIKKYIDIWEERRDSLFDEFERKDKSDSLEEDFQITGFDPMNIVKRDNEMIHQNFLRIKIGEAEQVIKGPVKAIIGSNFFDVKRIEW